MTTPQDRHKEKMNRKAEGRLSRTVSMRASEILAAPLLSMCAACTEPPDSSERAVFLTDGGKPRPDAVAIGWDLWRAGGTCFMLSALREVPAYDRGELEHAWDGIGADHDRWRC